MKNIMTFLAFIMMIVACENANVNTEMGTISGTVTIGPLCGNIQNNPNTTNPCGFSDEQIDQIYAKYKVTLNGKVDGKTITNNVTLNKSGLFNFNVQVGTYKIEVVLPEGSKVINSNELVKEVTVSKNEITKVDIKVDTGIL
jgi:hypothetical protein